MAVVINEFEATAEAATPREGSGGSAASGTRIEPQPLRHALRHQARRAERLRAH